MSREETSQSKHSNQNPQKHAYRLLTTGSSLQMPLFTHPRCSTTATRISSLVVFAECLASRLSSTRARLLKRRFRSNGRPREAYRVKSRALCVFSDLSPVSFLHFLSRHSRHEDVPFLFLIGAICHGVGSLRPRKKADGWDS